MISIGELIHACINIDTKKKTFAIQRPRYQSTAELELDTYRLILLPATRAAVRTRTYWKRVLREFEYIGAMRAKRIYVAFRTNQHLSKPGGNGRAYVSFCSIVRARWRPIYHLETNPNAPRDGTVSGIGVRAGPPWRRPSRIVRLGYCYVWSRRASCDGFVTDWRLC